MKHFRLLTRYVSLTGKVYEPHQIVEKGEIPEEVEAYLLSTNRLIEAIGYVGFKALEDKVEAPPAHEIEQKPAKRRGRPRKYEVA